MITHRQLRVLTVVLLVVVMGMLAADLLWLRGKVDMQFALIYWGICTFLVIFVLLLAIADIRYLKAHYLVQRRELLKRTMSDKDFVRKLEQDPRKKEAQDEYNGNTTTK